MMHITQNGVKIAGIRDVQQSTVFTDSVAILDTDNVWIHMSVNEFDKMVILYNSKVKYPNTRLPHVQTTTDETIVVDIFE